MKPGQSGWSVPAGPVKSENERIFERNSYAL